MQHIMRAVKPARPTRSRVAGSTRRASRGRSRGWRYNTWRDHKVTRVIAIGSKHAESLVAAVRQAQTARRRRRIAPAAPASPRWSRVRRSRPSKI